jgi:LacI family transcriptional regulator
VITLLVWRLSSAYFTEIAFGVRTAAERRGFDVNVVDAGPLDAELRALRQLRTGASEGVIVATGYHTTRGPALEAMRELVGAGAPLVMLLDRTPDPRIPSIRIDDEHGAYLATHHLVSLGHRRIAHISVVGGRLDENDGSPQFDRYQGYVRALREAGLAVDPRAVVQGPGLMPGGRQSALELLARFPDRRSRPTAVFVYNDLAAVGMLRALYQAAIDVPRDMAIVGFHGLELGEYTTPSLTSIGHPRAELGELGAALLLERIEQGIGPAPFIESVTPAEQVLPVELLIRESCGATLHGAVPA